MYAIATLEIQRTVVKSRRVVIIANQWKQRLVQKGGLQECLIRYGVAGEILIFVTEAISIRNRPPESKEL
jgi:hypothetical protein